MRKPNEFIKQSDEISLMVLSNGVRVLVDTEMVPVLSQKRWWFLRSRNDKNYVASHNPGTKQVVLLHRFLMNAPDGQLVDHINNNSLDYRKSNLRFATVAQNQHNSRRYLSNTSGFKGVHLRKESGRWMARIEVYGKRITLGCFNTAKEAGDAYAEAAQKYFGEFARVE